MCSDEYQHNIYIYIRYYPKMTRMISTNLTALLINAARFGWNAKKQKQPALILYNTGMGPVVVQYQLLRKLELNERL